MRVGYARVSTHEQNLDLQLDELKRAGCEEIVTDKISGSVSERPGLEKLQNYLRKGDVLVVWRLDRLGRSLKHLIAYVAKLEEKGIGFHSVTESIRGGSRDTRANGSLHFYNGLLPLLRIGCSLFL